MRFARNWSGRRDSNPQPSAWESNPVVLVYQHFSIFPKVFAIAYFAVFACFLPHLHALLGHFWDKHHRDQHSSRQHAEE